MEGDVMRHRYDPTSIFGFDHVNVYHKTFEQQDSERHKMHTCERLSQPLIIARQAAKARGPGVTALHHPAPGPQHKTFFRLGQLHYVQAHMVGLGILRGLFPGIPLIHKRYFDRVACHL
jgi:hypothetical protein